MQKKDRIERTNLITDQTNIIMIFKTKFYSSTEIYSLLFGHSQSIQSNDIIISKSIYFRFAALFSYFEYNKPPGDKWQYDKYPAAWLMVGCMTCT
jgi:hypothetical protein